MSQYMGSAGIVLGVAMVILAVMVQGGGSQTGAKPAAGLVEGKPIACQLSPRALTARNVDVDQLFTESTETRELEDGYAFQFPGDGEWAHRLLAFVEGERQCCQFLTFELTFEPNRGPIWLRVRGSAEIVGFIAAMMIED